MQLLIDFWKDPILVDHAARNWLLQEQDLLLHLIFQHPNLRKRVGWVHLNVINAYPDEEETLGWEPGDLVIHFPNCRYPFFQLCGLKFRNEHTCKELFERFWSQREVLETVRESHGDPPHLIGQDEIESEKTQKVAE